MEDLLEESDEIAEDLLLQAVGQPLPDVSGRSVHDP
jgi:hypothetical protein